MYRKNQVKLMGDGPYPYPMDKLDSYLEILGEEHFSIYVVKQAFQFETNSHHHDSYEFLIPYTAMPFVSVDGITYYVDSQMIFPIDCNQIHGPSNSMTNIFFSCIMIEHSYFETIAHKIDPKNSIQFKNKMIPLYPELKELISKYIKEATNKTIGYRIALDALSNLITVSIIRKYQEALGYSNRSNSIEERKSSFEKSIDFLKNYYYTNDFTISHVSKIANMSVYYYTRLFKKIMQRSPYDYLIDLRIQKACELLVKSQLSITDICFQCGFSNHSHFSSTFRKRMNLTPSNYRKKFTAKLT